MKTTWIASLTVFLVGLPLCAQTSLATNVSARPLSRDQLTIYRDFLSHYEEYVQLSNLLGMQSVTVPFAIDTFGGIDRSVYGPKGCLYHLKMEPQSGIVHRLPPEIMQFGNFDSVSRRIAAARTQQATPKGSKGVGPDGYVLTNFTLSEIIFDVTHRHAVFNFSANCNCLGGQGGTVLYELKGGKWTKSKTFCDEWEG
jgi:hypothetical protein